ncbi:hypothetical protein FWH09_02560 [Candidatus Saccharibacteria bacterium]|nr:hypothetical protein [Candidatus Saccharibacteria bacterium]
MSEDSAGEAATPQEEAVQVTTAQVAQDEPAQIGQSEQQAAESVEPSTEPQAPEPVAATEGPAPASESAPEPTPAPTPDPTPAPAPAPTPKEEEPNTVEMRRYLQDGMLADGRICALFLPDVHSGSPMWQFDLVFKDLARDVSSMAIGYADFGRYKFNPGHISDKVAEEISKREFSRYLVIGMGLGGQLAYEVLTKLDEGMAARTTGILFSAPASEAEMRSVSPLEKWLCERNKVVKFLDKFRKIYWKLLEKREDLSKYHVDIIDAYLRKRGDERNFPVDIFFAQKKYFYEFEAKQAITSRLIVVDDLEDKVVKKNAAGWDKVATEIEHRKMIGGYTDMIVGHSEYSRIIVDEISREEAVLKKIVEEFSTVRF